MENTNRASASITKTASFGRISVPDIVICGVKVPRSTRDVSFLAISCPKSVSTRLSELGVGGYFGGSSHGGRDSFSFSLNVRRVSAVITQKWPTEIRRI